MTCILFCMNLIHSANFIEHLLLAALFLSVDNKDRVLALIELTFGWGGWTVII